MKKMLFNEKGFIGVELWFILAAGNIIYGLHKAGITQEWADNVQSILGF